MGNVQEVSNIQLTDEGRMTSPDGSQWKIGSTQRAKLQRLCNMHKGQHNKDLQRSSDPISNAGIVMRLAFLFTKYYMQSLHSFAAGGNYHHSMFHNPTAAVNLFHVGKQYLTLCKAKVAVTRNLIGRKIISNVKHADARNSLPILDVIRSSHKRHSASEYCK